MFTQGRRHTLGYRCSETCNWPESEAYPEKEPSLLASPAEWPGKTLLSVQDRWESKITAKTTAKSSVGSNRGRNLTPRLQHATYGTTATTFPTALPHSYLSTLDLSHNKWILYKPNLQTTKVPPSYVKNCEPMYRTSIVNSLQQKSTPSTNISQPPRFFKPPVTDPPQFHLNLNVPIEPPSYIFPLSHMLITYIPFS